MTGEQLVEQVALASTIRAERDAIVAELDRELDWRERHYPDLVTKGRLDPRDAEYRVALWRSIAGDVADHLDAASWLQTETPPWHDKVRELEREIADRERTYPEHVRKGRADQATADRRLALVRLTHQLYWSHLFGWSPPAGPALDALRRIRAGEKVPQDDPGREELSRLVWAHIQIVDGVVDKQEELEL